MKDRMIRARRLTARGDEHFNAVFNPVDARGERLKTAGRGVVRAALSEDEWSVAIEPEILVPAKLPGRKWEMAKAICDALGDRFDEFLHDASFWNWLTLANADAVLGGRPGGSSPVKLGEQNVYNVHPRTATGRLHQFRHRLWGPAFVWNRIGEDARVCLTGPVHEMSDVLDAVMTYNLLTPEIIRALNAMYYDGETDTLTARSRPRQDERTEDGLRTGAIRECLAQIGQIAATRAIHLLTAEQILDALPEAEFGRHVETAREKLGISSLSMAA